MSHPRRSVAVTLYYERKVVHVYSLS